MKSKISFSSFATWLTAILSIALLAGCIATVKEDAAFFMILGVFLILYISSLFFGPAYIKADRDYIVMGSLLRSKKIPMKDVVSIELFQPTMGAVRVFASGGYMGYWGVFRESDIGKYYGFYGKASDCFLLRLKDGRKYVLGCNEPNKMVDYIKLQIGN